MTGMRVIASVLVLETTTIVGNTQILERISPLSRVKLKIITTRLTACGYNFKFNSLEWRNIATHEQLKENLYIHFVYIYMLLFPL
jgi:hypothetical protein